MDEYTQKRYPRINPAELLRNLVDIKVESVIQSKSGAVTEEKPRNPDEYRYVDDHRTDYE